jgi:hypothetical protein
MGKNFPFCGAIEDSSIRNRGYEPTGSVKGAKNRKGGDCVEPVITNTNRNPKVPTIDSFVYDVPSAKVKNG